MKTPGFMPDEVLFSPTTRCNLRCDHCDIERGPAVLNKTKAIKFVSECAKIGIRRIGFTGGEPFLALSFLCAVSKEAARRGMLFGRIMTNGSWFNSARALVKALNRLYNSGYDGDLCLSVDAFHRQDISKCTSLARVAISIWRRPDIVSIASVRGAKESETHEHLTRLARILNARLVMAHGKPIAIKSKELFIKILPIDLSPIGKASKLKNGWDGKWFKDDLCKGPGNVFFVLPDGTVKPCCGYATDADILTIGSIKQDSPEQLIRNARKSRFVNSVFSTGLHAIRKRLERKGLRFPGKTTNSCFFCHYLTHSLPRPMLERCL